MGVVSLTKLEKKYAKALVYMLTGGFEYLVEQSGGVCLGISVRSTSGDSLLVIRADFEGKRMVAFVGAATGAGAIVRAHKELRKAELKWRKDMYEPSG